MPFDYLVYTEENALNVLRPCVLQLREKRVYDVETIVRNITRGARNELERLRAIWVWLCHNIGGFNQNTQHAPGYFRTWGRIYCCQIKKTVVFVEYDVSGYLGLSEKLGSPEEVIAAGRGVCCSYSNLCSEMCR